MLIWNDNGKPREGRCEEREREERAKWTNERGELHRERERERERERKERQKERERGDIR